MAIKFGNAFYWLGCGAAAAFLTWAALNAAVMAGIFGAGAAVSDNMGHAIMASLAALGSWLFGRACRYILAGT